MAQNNYKGPMDYIDVATRIADFREKFPEGRLRQKDVQFLEFANKHWVVYTAEAWRTEDDPAPAQGTAWEPVPGPTNFTRDSELQNAETAAWGRAIVAAMASDTKEGIASREEVRNRQEKAQEDQQAKRKADLKAWADSLMGFEKQGNIQQVQAGMDWAQRNGDQEKFNYAQGILTRMQQAEQQSTEPQSAGSVLEGEVVGNG